ncbi:MAG: desulfoferrodoxin [Lentisphaeria bacterium]|nr:desulfoferrodoxin [Lentisphaeria bacterium]MBQ7394285.1 desulfoferrodoxin [Lentisphaeria bacterium]
MTEKNQIYMCAVCGNIVEVVEPGAGELVCCGKAMQLQKPNTVDASQEKHVPVIKADGCCTVVTIGSAPHPMEASHFIGWVELLLPCGKIIRGELKPGDEPQVRFPVPYDEHTQARAWCNVHGLWQK